MTHFLAGGHNAVVAHIAISVQVCMVKTAIRFEFQKRAGVVAVIAFGVRRRVMGRLANGYDTVVALAALTNDFQMVHIADNFMSEGGMTGFTHIGGGKVIRYFSLNRRIPAVVTVRALSGI